MENLTNTDKEDNWFWMAERTINGLNFLKQRNPAFDTIYIQAQKLLEYAHQDRIQKSYPDVPS